MTDITLQEGQRLTEHWHVEFTGKSRIHKPAEQWVECRIVKMYHSTIYGGANGTGKNVDEARLTAVIGIARAICDDVSAFDHDADEIFKAEQLRWWKGKLQEENDYLDDEEDPKHIKKLRRRIASIEQLMAEWQDEHDYWPEEDEAETATEARAAQIREATARRRAAIASLSATAAAVEAGRATTSAS